MFCEKCGREVLEGANFCVACGAMIGDKEPPRGAEENVNSAPEKANTVSTRKSKAKMITLIIRNSLITLLAVIMFAFSFLPIMSVGVSESNLQEINAYFSPIDSVSMLVSSFSEYELADNPLYDEMIDLGQELNDKMQSYSEKEALEIFKYEISRLAILTMKLSLMTEGQRAPISFWFAGVLSILYMALTVAFLVLSVLNLLGTFKIIKTGKRFSWWSNAVFAAAPVMLLLLFFVMGISYSATAKASLSGWSIAALIIAAITVVYSIVERMIFTKNKNVRVLVMRSVVAVLLLVVMILTLAPVCYGSVSRKNLGINAGAFNGYSTLDEDAFEPSEGIYDKTEINNTKSLYKTLSEMTARELEKSGGISLNNAIIQNLLVNGYNRSAVSFFSFLPAVYIIIATLSALAMWHAVKYLITGKENKTPYLVFRILTFVMAGLALAMAISFTAVMAHGARTVIGYGYTVAIGASPIVMISLLAVVLSMPTFKSKYVTEPDEPQSVTDIITEIKQVESNAVEVKENNCTKPSVFVIYEEIKKLKELYDMGAITDEEFSAKKAQLLGL